MSFVIPNQVVDDEGWINVKFKKYTKIYDE